MPTALGQADVLADERSVHFVRVVVHTMGTPIAAHISDNHWSIYLVVEGGTVRINMIAEFEDPVGRLEWNDLQYNLTRTAIMYWDFEPITGLNVAKVAQILYSLNRQRYEFSGGGSGCRWWVFTAMKDLCDNGLIPSEGIGELWDNLQYRYHKDWPRQPINMVRGQFY